MHDKFGSGKSNNQTTTDLHKGLTNKSPKWPDASARMKDFDGKGGGSVNDDATRSSIGQGPKSLGPRTA